MSPWRWVLFVLLVGQSGCGSCDFGREVSGGAALVVHVEPVLDQTPPSLRPIVLEPRWAQDHLRSAMAVAGSSRREISPEIEAGSLLSIRPRLTYGFALADGLQATPSPGDVVVRWQVVARLTVERAPELAFEYGTEHLHRVPFPGGDAEAALRQAVLASLAPLCERLLQSATVAAGTQTSLRDALTSPDISTRRIAADRVGQLRLRGLAPVVGLQLAAETDEALRLRLIGLSGELGDPATVPALIAQAELKDRPRLLAVMDALSRLGGARVEEFFDVLSSHDDPEIRGLVEAARGRAKSEHP